MEWKAAVLLLLGLLLVSRMIYSLNTTRQYSFRNPSIAKKRKNAFVFGLVGGIGLLIFFINIVTK